MPIISRGSALSLVRDIANNNPVLVSVNTGATCHEFTKLVLKELARLGFEGWGHIGKTAGEGQYRPPDWKFPHVVGADGRSYRLTGVSHDAIFHLPTNTQVDILGNANDGPEPFGSAAQPVWNEIAREHYRPNNPWFSFNTEVVTPVEPTPTPAPPPVDLSGVLERLARIEAALDRLANTPAAPIATRLEVAISQNDRILRQLASPPEYKGSIFGVGVTLRPINRPVEG